MTHEASPMDDPDTQERALLAVLESQVDRMSRQLFPQPLPQLTLDLTHSPHAVRPPACAAGSIDWRLPHLSLSIEWLQAAQEAEVMAFLAHHLVHLWQHHAGQAGRRGYHNQEWAGKMRSIGLVPSTIGGRRGSQTGDRVGQAVKSHGRLAELIAGLPPLPRLEPHQAAQKHQPPPPGRSKTTYACVCGTRVWGRSRLRLLCMACGQPLQEAIIAPPTDPTSSCNYPVYARFGPLSS